MAITYFNSLEAILKALKSIIFKEFGSSLEVSIMQPIQSSNQGMVIIPTSSSLVESSKTREVRQYNIDFMLRIGGNHLKPTSSNYILNIIARIEQLITLNKVIHIGDYVAWVTKTDGKSKSENKAYDCAITSTNLDASPEEGVYNVLFTFECKAYCYPYQYSSNTSVSSSTSTTSINSSYRGK